MDTLIVGDLHGDVNTARRALDSPHHVVFIGDYLDSFTFSVESQIQLLDLVLDSAESGEAEALLGNHELSYLDPYMRCSGWNPAIHHAVQRRRDRMERLLRPYTWVDGWLVSHAGVSARLLTWAKTSVDAYLKAANFDQIGYARGGRCAVGGLHWCDWWHEFEPVPGLRQVVGHTNYRPKGERPGIVSKYTETEDGEYDGMSYNIDCLTRVSEALLIDDGKATIEEI